MYSGSDGARRAALAAGLIASIAAAALVLTHASRGASHRPTRIVVGSTEPRPVSPDPSVLRVCADPNNLPFSNDRRQGFENEIADLVGRDLGRRVEYYWQPQRRGFIRTTLNAGWCDVVMGVPAEFEKARPTRPYYRSSYVFVIRRGARRIRSLDDPRLRRTRIGVEMTGEDYDNPPAVQALAARHIIDNVRGYLVYGDYSKPDPPRRVIDAVASGEVDTAIAWGPLAGYFAARSATPLDLVPIAPERDGPGLSFAFDIAMAVRRRDTALHDALDAVLARRAREIRAILEKFGVPLLAQGGRS
jgi:mxaJ protein